MTLIKRVCASPKIGKSEWNISPNRESLQRRELSNGRDRILKYITPPHSNGWVRRYVGTLVRRVCSYVPTFLRTELLRDSAYPLSHGSIGFIESITTWMSSLSNCNADNTRSVTHILEQLKIRPHLEKWKDVTFCNEFYLGVSP